MDNNKNENPFLDMLLDIHEKVSETNESVAVIKAIQKEERKRIEDLNKTVARLDKEAGLIKGGFLLLGIISTVIGIIATISKLGL